MTNGPACVFCAIAAGTAVATVVAEWPDALAILPRADKQGCRGCTDGHAMVIPRVHVADFTTDPAVTGAVMVRAAQLAARDDQFAACNLITSRGALATQSVFHLHVHLVPRRENDGLALPWTAR